jgi:hypothetical protein
VTAKSCETASIDEAGFDAVLAVFRMSSRFANSRWGLRVGGQRICPLVATKLARSWHMREYTALATA